jgi:hypothetical protein
MAKCCSYSGTFLQEQNNLIIWGELHKLYNAQNRQFIVVKHKFLIFDFKINALLI